MTPPLGYLLTWTAYGTWLRGDPRGWAAKGAVGGQAYREPDPGTRASDVGRLKHPPVRFDPDARVLIAGAITDVCAHRGWVLHAVNPRSNHVHAVVSASKPPERVMSDCKAWCTRCLREAGRVVPAGKVWTAHGSTRYLNTRHAFARAVEYVLHEQDRQSPCTR